MQAAESNSPQLRTCSSLLALTEGPAAKNSVVNPGQERPKWSSWYCAQVEIQEKIIVIKKMIKNINTLHIWPMRNV